MVFITRCNFTHMIDFHRLDHTFSNHYHYFAIGQRRSEVTGKYGTSRVDTVSCADNWTHRDVDV